MYLEVSSAADRTSPDRVVSLDPQKPQVQRRGGGGGRLSVMMMLLPLLLCIALPPATPPRTQPSIA